MVFIIYNTSCDRSDTSTDRQCLRRVAGALRRFARISEGFYVAKCHNRAERLYILLTDNNQLCMTVAYNIRVGRHCIILVIQKLLSPYIHPDKVMFCQYYKN